MNENQKFIQFHEALMKVSHHPDFINDSRPDKLTALADLCARLLAVDRVSVWRLNPDETAIESEVVFHLEEGSDPQSMRLSQALNPDYFAALLKARIIDAHHAHRDGRTRGFARDYLVPLGIASMLDAPVFNGGRLSGVVCLEAYRQRTWTLPEMSFVTAIADTISLVNTYEAWSASQQALDYITHYDDLTGLPNLKSLRQRLSRLIQGANRGAGEPFALFWIDLDRIKVINDGMGQMVGNQVLQETANRLRHFFVPGKDKIARCGGDEFAVLIRGRPEQGALQQIADQLLASIAQPIQVGDHTLSGSATLGISLFPEDGPDANSLLKHGEAAMYHAKELGRGRALFYSTSISNDARSRFLLESQLRNTIANRELEVYYQPIVEAHSRRLALAEALVRWNHPTRGLLSPGQFLDLARRGGMMPELGETVLRTVCEDVRKAEGAGLTMPLIAINLSSDQLLEPRLPERIRAVLAEFGQPGHRFEFEVTEDAIKGDSEALKANLKQLVAQGAKLSIDDFGTGYSSLARLKHLPFSKLKIDRSFICDLPGESDDCAITLSILGLARGLGMSVVAEGVETESQERWLQQHKCDFLQGYYYSHPLPYEAFVQGFLAQ